MRILVIGGNGFIGTPLLRQLREAGHEVAVFHRRHDPGLYPEIEQIRGDRNRLQEHRDQLADFSPDVIVDLILSSGEQARQLMGVARGVASRVAAISSMDVYRAWGIVQCVESGPLEPLPLTEDSPLRTCRKAYPPEAITMMQRLFSWLDDNYDKIAVEEAIMGDPELSGTVLRLPMVYGPGDPLHRFFPVIKRVNDGRSFLLFADDLGAWRAPRGYVDNVAHAIALAATSDRAAGRIYNVCEEPSFSDIEWQKQIASQMGWTGRFVVLPRQDTPKHLLQPGNAAQHIVASSERIRSELGYRELVDRNEAICRTLAWEQQNPPATVNREQFDYVAEDAALARTT